MAAARRFSGFHDYIVFADENETLGETNESKDTSVAQTTVPSPLCYGRYPLLQQIRSNCGDGKVLDEYIIKYVGLSALCKIGGDSMQSARRKVLASLIYHSDCHGICKTEVETLNSSSSLECKPNAILLEVWRASQKVIEYYIRKKQQTGVDYSLVSEELCRKAEFLLEINPNIAQHSLQSRTGRELSETIIGSSSANSFEVSPSSSAYRGNCVKNLSEAVEFFQSKVEVDALRVSLQRVLIKTIFRSAGLRAVSLVDWKRNIKFSPTSCRDGLPIPGSQQSSGPIGCR